MTSSHSTTLSCSTSYNIENVIYRLSRINLELNNMPNTSGCLEGTEAFGRILKALVMVFYYSASHSTRTWPGGICNSHTNFSIKGLTIISRFSITCLFCISSE